MRRDASVLVMLAWLGAATAWAQFPVPHIEHVEVSSPQAGAQIVVTGTDFGDAPGVLWIANGPAQIVSWEARRIVATIPRTAVTGAVWVMREETAQSGNPIALWSNGLQTITLPTPPTRGNGIVVHDVSVYDNLLLQQMLTSDRVRLSGMQFLDQAKVAGNIGAIQGASMQQSAISLNVGGPPVPGVSSVVNSGNTSGSLSQGTSSQNTSASVTLTSSPGATATPPSSELQITGPTAQTSNTNTNQTQVTGPSTQTTYTLSQPTAPTPAASPSTWYPPPSGFSPSASSVLNEEMQLNSEAAGLLLIMEGSQSDQVYPIRTPEGHSILVQKHHITLGVPITIFPSKEDEDAAAEIVLTIDPAPSAALDGAPRITAILPEDKTYNAATISNKSLNFGAGIVTGVLTAGVNWLWQKQTYYIVQAQDTVAFQLSPDLSAPARLSFGWDLRPVLGNPTVSAGNRTLFVQLAFTPSLDEVTSDDGIDDWAIATVSTRWRKIDKKTGLISFDAFGEPPIPLAFPVRDVNHRAQILNIVDPVDNGDGTLSVHIKTSYYSNSTYIRIGSLAISQGSTNATFFPNAIDFTAPATLLATQAASLSDPTGLAAALQVPSVRGLDHETKCLSISNVMPVEESATSVKVTANVTLSSSEPCIDALQTAVDQSPNIIDIPLVAVIGNKVFGYRDAPIYRIPSGDGRTETIIFHASPDLVRSSPVMIVERLFWGDSFKAKSQLRLLPLPVIDKATVVKKSKENLEIALIGSNLRQLSAPPGMGFLKDGKSCSEDLDGFSDTDTGRLLCVSGNLLASLTQAALTSASGDLLLVALPTKDKPDTTAPTLRPHGSLDADVSVALIIKGTNLDSFDHVEINKAKIPAELADDKKSIIIHLAGDLVKPPKIELVFFFKGSKNVSYTVTVGKKTQ